MTEDIIFSEYNFRLINFCELLKASEITIINELHVYGLLEKAKLTKDVKRIIMHHITLCVCSKLLSVTGKEKWIIYFNKIDLQESLLVKHFINVDVLIESFLIKLKNLLPIRIYMNGKTFKELQAITSKKNGNRDEFLAGIRLYLERVDFAGFTFSKIKLFTQKQGLTFLNKDFFNTLKSKQLLLT